jgi:ribosomal protein S12 methylthiotransferase
MKKNNLAFSKKAAIITNNINCERHMEYYSRIEKYLLCNGWEICEHFDVDKVFICGCGFHDMMYDKVKSVVEHLKKIHFLEKNITIMACVAKTHELDLKTRFNGQIVKFNQEHLLDNIIQAKIPFAKINFNNLLRLHKDSQQEGEVNNFFYIKIAEGCLRKCTFCVINKAKGYIRSFPREDIVRQFKEAIKLGYQQIYLMAEDTFAYGIDRGSDIIQLIDSLLAIRPDVELYFGSLHIKWLTKYSNGLLKLCKKGIIKELHIGLQHVNNMLLKRMGRATDFAHVYDIIQKLKKECPDLYLGVDIIVGFPGETREIFNELLEFFKQDSCFDIVRHNGFGAVKGAPASEMKDKVPHAEIVSRWEQLNEVLQDRSPNNQLNEASLLSNATYRLTRMKEYSFCKNTFKDTLEYVPDSPVILPAKVKVLGRDRDDFGF